LDAAEKEHAPEEFHHKPTRACFAYTKITAEQKLPKAQHLKQADQR
jgi:hypothetical protein